MLTDETITNSQIAEAARQANLEEIADTPVEAMGNLYQTVSRALALAAYNGVAAQQQLAIVHQALTDRGIITLYPAQVQDTCVTEHDIIGFLIAILHEHYQALDERTR